MTKEREYIRDTTVFEVVCEHMFEYRKDNTKDRHHIKKLKSEKT